MGYNKTTWTEETLIDVPKLQKIEDGIEELDILTSGKVIEESASNENGSYIKFADGTALCWKLLTFTSGGTVNYITVGNSGVSSNPLPINFISSGLLGILGLEYRSGETLPGVMGSAFFVDGVSRSSSWGRVRFAKHNSTDIPAGEEYRATLFAIGKWK